MPSNLSFFLTLEEFKSGLKDVTRRLNKNGPTWQRCVPGHIYQAVKQAQGLRKGEKIVKLNPIRIITVRQEPVYRMLADPEYGKLECIREGFPEYSPEQFVSMLLRENRIDLSEFKTVMCTRMQFIRITDDFQNDIPFHPSIKATWKHYNEKDEPIWLDEQQN